jgi:hypothetical protein
MPASCRALLSRSLILPLLDDGEVLTESAAARFRSEEEVDGDGEAAASAVAGGSIDPCAIL